MSELREIMRRLNTKATRQPDQERPVDLQLLGVRSEQYLRELQRCTDAMLQYEWAWLEEHVQALRRSQLQPELMVSLGGEDNVKILISECVLFQLILQEEFGRRHLTPRGTTAPIVPSEEAWEITSLKVKQDWGIVPA